MVTWMVSPSITLDTFASVRWGVAVSVTEGAVIVGSTFVDVGGCVATGGTVGVAIGDGGTADATVGGRVGEGVIGPHEVSTPIRTMIMVVYFIVLTY